MNAITRIALLSFLLLGANSARSDVVVPVDAVASFVNIRFAPDAKSEVVGQLHQGSSLQFIETDDGWYEVALEGGGNGYVSADWALVVSDDEFLAMSSEETPEGMELEAVDEVDDQEITDVAVAEVTAIVDEAAVEPAEHDVEVEEVEEVVEVVEVVDVKEVAEVVSSDVEPEPELAVGTQVVEDEAVESDSGESVLEANAETGPDPLLDVEGAEAEAQAVAEPYSASPDAPESVSAVPINFEGSVDYLVKFIAPTEGGISQVFDDGRNVGIGTSEPQQRLEVNGNIQIHEQNSNVAGLMITQSSGDMGYIMHNRASTLTIGAGSVDRITITRDGNVGFGVNRPAHPVDMASGAHVTVGGVWTNSSSIEKKENVRDLSPEEALAALALLEPVKFNYKADDREEYVGFIAEDVPELVATSDRTGLSAMDIVAVLTSVVQQQQKKIEELEARLNNP